MKRNRLLAAATGAALAAAALVPVIAAPANASPTPAAPAAPTLTNLAHLNFLLDDVPLLPGVAGHSTYQQSQEPSARAPWVYANRNADGSFTRVGGGPITNAAKGWYAQGSFDADDISRSAVVYLRDWKQNGTAASRASAYELLRELTYLQVDSGPNAGNVVLWQQHDGTLNPSAIPADNPNPSDSGESYWLARTVWALGEGYAGFQKSDPAFASFLQQRMDLGLRSLERQSLAKYGTTDTANGVTVPGWLITNSAAPTAEAVLGLSAYTAAAPGDAQARTDLQRYAKGIAGLSSGGTGQWPFGALLPEANSPTFWHAWGGMQPAALTAAATQLHDGALQSAANTDLASFTPQLLASGGPDNGWTPTPADQSQIAYGVDSRVEGLVAASDATGSTGLATLAGAQAAWYFGANPAGVPVYDPATGVCVDGIGGDGGINHNCGAESVIHTELSMLALDAHPAIKREALALTHRSAADGLQVVEAEKGTLAGPATVVTPPSAWTGSANWSGGAYVSASTGATVTMSLPAGHPAARILPIEDLGPDGTATSGSGTTAWTASASNRTAQLGSSQNVRPGAQGIAPTTVFLLPQTLPVSAPVGATTVTATVSGQARLDAVLVQPEVSHLGLTGSSRLDVYVNATSGTATQHLGSSGPVLATRYDASGRQVGAPIPLNGNGTVTVVPGGFTTVVPR
ncbi:hypothetical protein ABCS02_30255 [Microbacterium sp. X-17]|uniref:hypothetical protein n=1 Tax=Microbacterium sp. X-17 TaxID=3144404 RepID=UPI0031F55BDC